jgi:hypothetical protein
MISIPYREANRGNFNAEFFVDVKVHGKKIWCKTGFLIVQHRKISLADRKQAPVLSFKIIQS